MNEIQYYKKLGFFYLIILMILLISITGYAAENIDDYRSVFDADYYNNNNPDLQISIGYDPEKLFAHFVSSGAREGRSGNEEFNLRAYVFNNPDLVNVYKTDLSAYFQHYSISGKAEGRICQPQENGQNVIGIYSTNYDPTVPRAVNIANAVQRINGRVLQPGEMFSFSSSILPRTLENGYVVAPEIGGMGVGGGICQVSSTLYAAMCTALLPATERYPHSSKVTYIPVGLDATIASGYKDLKFVNPYQEPLFIQATVNEGVLTVVLRFEREAKSEDQDNIEQEQEQTTESQNEAAENMVIGPASRIPKE